MHIILFRSDIGSLEDKAREFSRALLHGRQREHSWSGKMGGLLPGRLGVVICCMVAGITSAVFALVRSRDN